MAIWGKIFGGVAGFAMGGPVGAALGAALGHAADRGSLLDAPQGGFGSWVGPNFLGQNRQAPDPNGAALRFAAKMAAAMGRRDQLYALVVVTLSAKLAKCDGPVNRREIDAFKRSVPVPPENQREIGRLFDQARTRTDDYEPFAAELGRAYADQPHALEALLGVLFSIGRADGELNETEVTFLRRVHRALGLPPGAWDRAEGGMARPSADEPDAYGVLGLRRTATDEEVRVTWRRLIREIHPDSVAARGASDAEVAAAGERVARINAAWDRIKRDRNL
ncbi:TerB family tellurite resistance protein [Rhizosaccharibacter radicis]|uniref:TerB family tellurite resistance protein n=1 Tax=Rhizosaccharibacter radicis TaxID=2782605 RepID=A0ABT1VTJ8_9PROT|nr:TerB family tellurite resistance protein [Acetobacteraceae bacterium KSS12]